MAHSASQSQEKNNVATGEQWTEFLTPEQRAAAVADILATAALRIIKEQHE